MAVVIVKEVLPCTDRHGFRQWLTEHHATAAECWVVVKKGRVPSGSFGVLSYLDAVEEALCFGWIDSTNKVQEGKHLQRFSPRKKNSPWSELNKERCRRLEKLGLMTDAGRRVLPEMSDGDFKVDPDIMEAFGANPVAWENFCKFPELYRRVRLDTIQRDKRKDLNTFRNRLNRLIACSERGEMFGDWNDYGRLTMLKQMND